MTENARLRGPPADSYLAAVALVVVALVPYLALSGAMTPLEPVLVSQLHTSKQAVQLTIGMANAAYAFGTVLAVQFAVHLPARRMLVLYAALFVVGSILAASAHSLGLFVAGHVLQGLTTSLMLTAAVPPLNVGWPTSRMRWTAVVMNLCIFGAVAAGPVIGGVQAATKAWHPLFWVALGIACGGCLLALAIWVLGRARLQRADLERWEEGDEPAWRSPPLLDGIKSRDTSARLRRRVRV